MILVNAITWHPMVITLNAGIRYLKNAGQQNRKFMACTRHIIVLYQLPPGLPAWQRVHDPVEKIQIVMFSAQEIAISFFYVRAAYKYLHSGFAKKDKVRGAMFLLILVQIVIISADTAIIVLDLAGYLKLKTFIHSFVYTVKLELEFVTLNQLVDLSKLGMSGTLSWAPTMMDASAMGAGDEMNKMTTVHVGQRDSAVDLEPCRSHTSWGTIDFITTPQHIDLK